MCSEHNKLLEYGGHFGRPSNHYSIARLVRVTLALVCHQRAYIHFLVEKMVKTEIEFY